MNAPQHAHPTPVIAPRPMPAEMVDALRARFGDRCSTAMAVRELHGRDESPFDVPPPDAVVYCESNQDVIDAVRASIALPGLFTPAQYGGHVLVDGGLVNPVPVSLCRAMGADVVIAVDLNWDLIGRRASALQTQPNASMEVHAEPPPKAGFFSGWFGGDRNTPPAAPHADQAADRSMLSVLATSLNIMQVRITQSRLAGDPADVVIRPRLAGIGAMDFDHAAVAIEQGEAATRLVMPQIVDVIGTGNELNHPGNSGDSLV